MNGWRKQDRLASVILVVIFLAGLLDGYRPQLIEQYLLLYTIIMSVLVIFWLYLDAASFPQKRPRGFAIIASLFFFPIGIWLHLMQTRSPARGTLLTIIVIAVYLSAYIGGFYTGETLA
jgi:CDP-diglyceride synthetase